MARSFLGKFIDYCDNLYSDIRWWWRMRRIDRKFSVYGSDNVLEYPKAVYLFVVGLACSWVTAWACNIFLWLTSLSFGSLLSSVVFCDVRGFWEIVYSIFSMWPYAIVSVVAFGWVGNCKKKWLLLFLYILMGGALIVIYDPNTTSILPEPLYSAVRYLQRGLHFRFAGGADPGSLRWSASLSDLDYGVYDVMTGILCLLFLRNYKEALKS